MSFSAPQLDSEFTVQQLRSGSRNEGLAAVIAVLLCSRKRIEPFQGYAADLGASTAQLINQAFKGGPNYARLDVVEFQTDGNNGEDAEVLASMDVCEHVPRLTQMGRQMLSQFNDSHFEDDKITNADLLKAFARRHLLDQCDHYE